MMQVEDNHEYHFSKKKKKKLEDNYIHEARWLENKNCQ